MQRCHKVGDVVEFTGSKHYVSATVERLMCWARRIYHLIGPGGGSTVYGWTDAADIKTSAAATATSYPREGDD